MRQPPDAKRSPAGNRRPLNDQPSPQESPASVDHPVASATTSRTKRKPVAGWVSCGGEGMSAAVSSAPTWADRIRPHLVGAVENIIAAGRELNEAKEALPHGTFGPLLDELGLSRQMANRFMRVAANQVLSNRPPVGGLPAAVSVLDELTRLDDETLTAAIEAGEVTSSTTRDDARALVELHEHEQAIERGLTAMRAAHPPLDAYSNGELLGVALVIADPEQTKARKTMTDAGYTLLRLGVKDVFAEAMAELAWARKRPS